jgi:Tfp pilus assembly protein PilF
MRRLELWIASLSMTLAGCCNASDIISTPITTNGEIAIENLDHQIAQGNDETGLTDLLLVRARFLADYQALDRASTIAEGRFHTIRELLQRARARSAVHRFADALADIAAAEKLGAHHEEIMGLRAAMLVATGRPEEVFSQLEDEVRRCPGYASHSALATAYAAVGRFDDADRHYIAALSELNTTSPFPYAWIYFARGLMWAEQAKDPARAEAFYAQALIYLPEFVIANIHLAEIEVSRGDLLSAIARLERVVASSNEPEAMSLLGQLHILIGDSTQGVQEIAMARERYESLLKSYPLAFADHAAEFYLGPGGNSERAFVLAQQNLANRPTERAYALAIKAARSIGRQDEACSLAAKAQSYLPKIVWNVCAERPVN